MLLCSWILLFKTSEKQASNTHWIKYSCFSLEVKSFYAISDFIFLKLSPTETSCPRQPGQNRYTGLPTASLDCYLWLQDFLLIWDREPQPPHGPSSYWTLPHLTDLSHPIDSRELLWSLSTSHGLGALPFSIHTFECSSTFSKVHRFSIPIVYFLQNFGLCLMAF